MRKPKSVKVVSRRSFLERSAKASLATALLANSGCSPASESTPVTPPPADPNRPNILLLSLDTTRADRMHFQGYSKPTSPHLDALAEESVVFTNALSTSSWTLPAHATMFTGKFVTTHGARKTVEGAISTGKWVKYQVDTIRPDERLLAESLRDIGYDTGAVIAGPWLKKNFGLHRGFDFHDEDMSRMHFKGKRLGEDVSAQAIAWLERERTKPFFLFLNYFDAHAPYFVPEHFESTFGESPYADLAESDKYDLGVYYMDWCVEQVLSHLRSTGAYDNTLIVAVSDHGHEFGEHGVFGHGTHLHQGSIHVPFFAKYPNGERPPETRSEFVQITEILPLLYERLDLPFPADVQGSPPDAVAHPIFAEVYPGESETDAGHWHAWVEDHHKLLFNTHGNHALYDLASDPNETRNLIHQDAARADSMKASLAQYFASLPRPGKPGAEIEIDDQTRDELEAMGYL